MDAGRRARAHPRRPGRRRRRGPPRPRASPSPRGSPPTSPPSPPGCPAPSSSSSSTSPPSPPSCRAACPPSAASASWPRSRRPSSSRSSPTSSPRCPVPVVVHCCAPRTPLELFRSAGAARALLRPRPGPGPRRRRHRGRGRHPPRSRASSPAPTRRCPPPKATASRVQAWWRELGFPADDLAAAVTLTPSCGLAGATPGLRAVGDGARARGREVPAARSDPRPGEPGFVVVPGGYRSSVSTDAELDAPRSPPPPTARTSPRSPTTRGRGTGTSRRNSTATPSRTTCATSRWSATVSTTS